MVVVQESLFESSFSRTVSSEFSMKNGFKTSLKHQDHRKMTMMMV
jgi:hypothetical protein